MVYDAETIDLRIESELTKFMMYRYLHGCLGGYDVIDFFIIRLQFQIIFVTLRCKEYM